MKVKNWFLRHPWLFISLVFTFSFVVLLWPLISLDRMAQGDASLLLYPNFTYIIDAFREGRIPFWDPYTKCGYPFHAEPYQPILNPFVYFLSLTPLGTLFGFIVFWLFHWWFAGMGMIWLGYLLELTPMGALVAAFSFAFSGFFVGHTAHTPFIITIAWLPWIMGLSELALSKLNLGYLLLTGFAFGMSALGGYPPLVAFSGLALGLWMILRNPKEWRKIILGLLVVALVLVMVSIPSLYAFLTEAVGHTARVNELDPKISNYTFSLTPTAMFSLIFPFSAFIAGTGVEGQNSEWADVYCGILTIPFILFWWVKTEKKKAWWIYFFAFMFLVSLGGRAGIRILLYYVFPPIRYIRFSEVFAAYWIFAAALAAGLGFSHFAKAMQSDRNETSQRFKALLKKYSYFVVVVGLALVIRQVTHHGKFLLLSTFLPAAFILPLVFYFLKSIKNQTIAVLILICVDLLVHVQMNHGLVWDSTNPLIEIERKHQFKTMISGEPGGRKEFSGGEQLAIQIHKDASILGYNTMIYPDYDALSHSSYATVLKSPIRFWLSPNARILNNREEALKILSSSSIGKPIPVFLEPEVSGLSQEEVVPGNFGSTKVTLYSPERIELSVDVPGGQKAALVSTERSGNSWLAQVDGIVAPVYTANLLFRGLVLTPGKHQVVWTYRPPFWQRLAIFSEVALFFSLIFGGFFVWRKKLI